MTSAYLVLDIETVALGDAADYLEPVAAPSNYKDAGKIAAYQAEKHQEQIEKAALDPDLCRVVCIGLRAEDGETETRIAYDERVVLDWCWQRVESERRQATLIGYNILGFDLPVLLRRSLYLSVKTPVLNLDRYRTPHIDLLQRLSHNGLLRARSLAFYCRRFGLDVPTDPVKGEDIAGLVAAGQWASVEAHCASDVQKTAALAARMGLLRRTPAVVA